MNAFSEIVNGRYLTLSTILSVILSSPRRLGVAIRVRVRFRVRVRVRCCNKGYDYGCGYEYGGGYGLTVSSATLYDPNVTPIRPQFDSDSTL